jgi:hypothetical protein
MPITAETAKLASGFLNAVQMNRPSLDGRHKGTCGERERGADRDALIPLLAHIHQPIWAGAPIVLSRDPPHDADL